MGEPLQILAAMIGFGMVHSLLASRAAKLKVQAMMGERHTRGIYRIAYNLAAVISLLPALTLLVALPDRELYRFPQPLAIAALAIQAFAALGLVYSVHQLDVPHFSGLRQLAAWLAGSEAHSESDTSARTLVVDGLHRYVRHPLYTTSLIVLWLVSPMTVNRLAFLLAATLYFYVGSIFEERKLVAEFGDAYREYQRRVPRLIPRIRPRFTASS
jgi:protein-S-isoprenylcysteine O-methyltransferase Ste14